MSRWETIEDVRCVRETEAALLCVIEGEEVWMPRSQVSDESEVQGEGDVARAARAFDKNA